MPLATGLEGGWVLVTGGTAGIGRACVHELAASGANVAFFSRKLERAEAVAHEEKGAKGRLLPLECDVADLGSVDRAFAELLRESGGRLDAVIHTATWPVEGKLWDTPLHEMDDHQVVEWFTRVADVDLLGSRLVTRAALRAMRPRRRGAFVFFSSTPALSGYKGLPYTEAKAAVLGLMKDVARAYGPEGIRANAIAPGNVVTSWLDDLGPEEREVLEKENPLERFAAPEELARAAIFLASDLASFVTGQTLVVDGGTESRP